MSTFVYGDGGIGGRHDDGWACSSMGNKWVLPTNNRYFVGSKMDSHLE